VIAPLLVGTTLLVACLTLTALATVAILHVTVRALRSGYAGGSFWHNVAVVTAVTLLAAAGHFAQMALWAGAFLACGEFRDFETAFYHSAVNYTSLGYGDIVMSLRWRLLGPLEAMTGLLLFGLSAATVFAVMSRLIDLRLHHGPASGANAPAGGRKGGVTQ
jgi:Ion channel